MNANRIEKLIEVTIRVDDCGDVDFDFHEPETGDFDRISTSVSDMEQEEKTRIADEILWWAYMMQDELGKQAKGDRA